MIISAGIALIAFGLLCVLDKNTTWLLYEHDARLSGKIIYRTRDWNNLMTMQGITLFILGIVGIVAGLG